MAWTTPRTFITAEIPTATQFNTHIRDNFLELGPAKAAAAGDFLLGGVGGLTLRRLPVGAPVGAVLVRDSASGAYIWSNQSVPAGMVIYFDGTTCPSGWTAVLAARGRLIVGRPAGGTLGGTVGSPLTNLGTRVITQVPTHYHSGGSISSDGVGGHAHSIYIGDYVTPFFSFVSSGGTRASTGAAGDHGHALIGTVDAAGTASVDVTNPYVQYLVCQKD